MTPDQVQFQLAGELAPATLVTGPGAGLLVAGQAGALGWTLWYDLSAAEARQVREEACLAPVSGLRVTALVLDGASDRVQDMLLKVLEEPPEATRFVLASTGRPLPTVVSRCRVLVLGPGEPEAVAAAADVAAVGAVIRAARARQPSVLYPAVRGWWKDAAPGKEPEPFRLLRAWAAEAASGRWRVFSPDLAPGVSPQRAVRLLAELARYPGSRLAPAVALETVFSQE
jgi:DNA polymerase III, delta subunit